MIIMSYVNYIPIKICKECKLPLETIDNYSTVKDHNGNDVFRNVCKHCIRKRNKTYYTKNKNKIIEMKKTKKYKEMKKQWDKRYAALHQSQIKKNKQKYYQAHKEKWQRQSTEKEKQLRNHREKIRKNTDPTYKLKTITSSRISSALKAANTSKQKTSFTKYVEYSMLDLKKHLESLFEPWMNWDNWGKYNKNTWNDNDQTTWTWQIDHIIPRYKLPYSSMNEDNFKLCWSLKNLRPLSAKQNIIDGSLKTR